MSHKRKYQCELCQKFHFFSQEELEHHQALHQSLSGFKCSVCNLEFVCADDYEGHQFSAAHQVATKERRLNASIADVELVEMHVSVEEERTESLDDDVPVNASTNVDILDDELLSSLLESNMNMSDSLETESRPLYFPYNSWPMLLLRQWYLQDGKLLSQTAFDSLLRLLFRLVSRWGSKPTLWPKNFQQIHNCEKQHIQKAFKVIETSQGKIILNPIKHVVQTMMSNPIIFDNLHFEYEETDSVGPLWTAAQWKESQEFIQKNAPEAKFFPLLAYSDKTKVLKSRAGCSLHPIVVAPAGVPREIWKKSCFKYTVAYISAGVPIDVALNYLVKELNSLAQGELFEDPNGNLHLLGVTILAWLGDHPELNDLAWLYGMACRRCYKIQQDGQWVSRHKEEGISNVNTMVTVHQTPGQKQTAYKLSQQLQQHIGYTPLMSLDGFDVYQQTPACPGHSENQGRTLRHLVEEFKMLDSVALKLIDDRLESIPSFPGLVLHWNKERVTMTSLIRKEVKLTSDELQSIRAVILFLLVGLLPAMRFQCWKYHVTYASGYYKKYWNSEDITCWEFIRDKFMQLFQKQFATQISWSDFPKGHDPQHDTESVQKFGSFLNLDEMNFEGCHQTSKNNSRNQNGQNLDLALLKKEDTRHQLESLFSNHAGFYEAFLHHQKQQLNDWFCKGKPQQENWTSAALQWKAELLQQTLIGMCGKQVAAEQLTKVSCFLKLHATAEIGNLTCSFQNDKFPVVLLKDQYDMPWCCIRQFFNMLNPLTGSVETWLLGSKFDWDDDPIDVQTGCPRLYHAVDNFIMLPVQHIQQLVHLVPDPRPQHHGAFWINWWVTFGPNPYPEKHREKMQLEKLY